MTTGTLKYALSDCPADKDDAELVEAVARTIWFAMADPDVEYITPLQEQWEHLESVFRDHFDAIARAVIPIIRAQCEAELLELCDQKHKAQMADLDPDADVDSHYGR